MVNIIVALGNYVPGKGYPIGSNNTIPWHNSSDLKWFKETTTGHPVIMGRKTFEAIGNPLPERTNVVVSRSKDLWQDKVGIRVCDSLESAIAFAKTIDNEIFIIGGASIYKYALDNNLVDKLYVDFLSEEVKDADSFFPDLFLLNDWFEEGRPLEIEPRKAYVMTYVKQHGMNNHVDEQYLNLVNEILEKGVEKDTRAGKTLSLFGKQLKFNLKEGLPMLTTKKMFAKGVIHELLWFLKGDTNIKYLVDNGVHIWDDDAYRYFLEKTKGVPYLNLTKEQFLEEVKNESTRKKLFEKYYYDQLTEEKKQNWIPQTINDDGYRCGDLGPVYGKQWRNWNGVDQVKELINKLLTNPDDRRLMISAWNVSQIPTMALPPCHYCCQFYTKEMTFKEREEYFTEYYDGITWYPDDEEKSSKIFDNAGVPKRKLSCMFQMRSVDTLLGLPFNILSYAILTHIIAACTNMDVDELIFSGGDVHVYKNQINTYVTEQKERNPHLYGLPKLVLNYKTDNNFYADIDNFKYEDVKIEGYESYPAIKLQLNVGL